MTIGWSRAAQASTTPANFNSISASASDSRGFRATNNGTLVQDGSGRLVTQGPAQFNNRNVFEIRNDSCRESSADSVIACERFPWSS